MGSDELGEFKALYSNIKALLGVSETDLSFDMFKNQANLLEMILETRGINLELLNASMLSLLLFYHLECELRRCGVINEFVQVKKKSLENLKLINYPQEVNSCNTKDYCTHFKSL